MHIQQSSAEEDIDLAMTSLDTLAKRLQTEFDSASAEVSKSFKDMTVGRQKLFPTIRNDSHQSHSAPLMRSDSLLDAVIRPSLFTLVSSLQPNCEQLFYLRTVC